MKWDTFFKIHDDLPREGPGSGDDVAWACAQAAKARAGCEVREQTGHELVAARLR